MIEINRNSLPKTVKHNGKTFVRNAPYDGTPEDQMIGPNYEHIIVNVKAKISGNIKQWVFSYEL